MPESSILELFHPISREWFKDTFGDPTPPQQKGWPEIAQGQHTLISAPTGSGKTLSAFFWSIDRLLRQGLQGKLNDGVQVIYVSPLKALGNDIEKNLQVPLDGLSQMARQKGEWLPEIRVQVRTGDTPQKDRQRMLKTPPHILVTTPESLYILLGSPRSRQMLSSAHTIIVDEIHAIVSDKRGPHLSLSLERLDHCCGRALQRIGLSATQKPIEKVSEYLVGSPDKQATCSIINESHVRELDLSLKTMDIELGPIATNEYCEKVYEDIAEEIRQHRSTLVFTGTRRLVEKVARHLSNQLGEGQVEAHHGSLSKESRLKAEENLKHGRVPVIVASASLELGIDVGTVDLVIHLGSPRWISQLLQRVGRAGHGVGRLPKGRLYPLTRDELLQSAAALRAIQEGDLDQLIFMENSLDILSQQIVAECAAEDCDENDLYERFRKSWAYRYLRRESYDQLIDMLSEGIAGRRGRKTAWLHRDRVQNQLKARRGAQLAALTSGGAIPDNADYDVVEEPSGALVGKVNEDFAIESMAGDIFQLGNHSWRIKRVEWGRVRVTDAQGLPPTIPFWLGESPGRSLELSEQVSNLRSWIADQIHQPDLVQKCMDYCLMDEEGAKQLIQYIQEGLKVLGAVPTCNRVIAERFFDESGGMQLILHTPFGARINRAWGLALRKSFCVGFDFELQAAATDDGIVLSLGEQHSFPIDAVFGFVTSHNLVKNITQAALQAPMFINRWRWNVGRSLAILRFQGGKRVPVPIQRMQAEDLLAAVFPLRTGCQDNRPAGNIEIPNHPLVEETMNNCLHEAMDLEHLKTIISKIEKGEIKTVAIETPAPSVFCHELLNANPYAFLDDAPLEERRARAVPLRRSLPDNLGEMGQLNPEVIKKVQEQSWPDCRNEDELHDHLLNMILLPVEKSTEWNAYLKKLSEQQRVGLGHALINDQQRSFYFAAECRHKVFELFPHFEIDQDSALLKQTQKITAEGVRYEMVRGWLELLSPLLEDTLTQILGIDLQDLKIALAKLEGEGIALQGQFHPSIGSGQQWCERRILSRIHKLTLGRLRKEIEAVSTSDYIRFLLRWQHLYPGSRYHGSEGLLECLQQFQGFELPAPFWEKHFFSSRIQNYDPSYLDHVCLSGQAIWGKLKVSHGDKKVSSFTKSSTIGFLLREDLDSLGALAEDLQSDQHVSPLAQKLYQLLIEKGASFTQDLAQWSGQLPSKVEEGLWELVRHGLISGDGVAGLRSLLTSKKVQQKARLRNFPLPTGRWWVWQRTTWEGPKEEWALIWAKQLLKRWGVLFREVTLREHCPLPWIQILRACRRLEERGEIRGGRFVEGWLGEQFALPEALATLRSIRHQPAKEDTPILIPAADPLNVAGWLHPGPRVSSSSNQFIAIKGGEVLASGSLGEVKRQFPSIPFASS